MRDRLGGIDSTTDLAEREVVQAELDAAASTPTGWTANRPRSFLMTSTRYTTRAG